MLKLYTAISTRLHVLTRKLVKKEEGASLVEYGLLVALIACACIVALQATGTSISSMFTRINTSLDSVTPPSAGAGS